MLQEFANLRQIVGQNGLKKLIMWTKINKKWNLFLHETPEPVNRFCTNIKNFQIELCDRLWIDKVYLAKDVLIT